MTTPAPHQQPQPDPYAALATLGWDQQWQRSAAAWPDLSPARVARTDRGRVLVLTGATTAEPDTGRPGETRHAELGPDLPADPTTGDWVLLDHADRVQQVLPRRTAFVRGAGKGDTRPQVLAANLDVVFVLVPLSAAPNLSRLERLLTLAWQSGARPVVLLSKADLAAAAEDERQQVAEAAIGVEVVLVSVVQPRGLQEVQALLPAGRTGALLGTSGAGKSSLVNALLGTDLLATEQLGAEGKGRHTSVTRELVALPWGALLIDTPGLRGVQLWDAEDGLDTTFADVIELTGQCRFADCGHETEPDCAVTEALADGRLSARRWESYRKLQREQVWLASRYDARLRAEQRQVWKARSAEGRSRRRR